MVASMVVFEDGQPKKSDYRRFSIDDDAGFDDTRAMHHVITRRFKRYLDEKDIDVAAEYLVMGAWLAFLKSKTTVNEPRLEF